MFKILKYIIKIKYEIGKKIETVRNLFIYRNKLYKIKYIVNNIFYQHLY